MSWGTSWLEVHVASGLAGPPHSPSPEWSRPEAGNSSGHFWQVLFPGHLTPGVRAPQDNRQAQREGRAAQVSGALETAWSLLEPKLGVVGAGQYPQFLLLQGLPHNNGLRRERLQPGCGRHPQPRPLPHSPGQ